MTETEIVIWMKVNGFNGTADDITDKKFELLIEKSNSKGYPQEYYPIIKNYLRKEKLKLFND